MFLTKLKESADYIRTLLPYEAKTAIILGSGLGSFGEALTDTVSIPYGDVPHMKTSSVLGHKGEFLLGKWEGMPILCMNGRLHYYEGHSMEDIGYPIHVLKALGIENLIVTNAAGGIREDFSPGTLMLISDHLKFSLDSPLRGKNEDSLGERFFDVSDAYKKCLRTLAKGVGEELGISLKEGVYAYMGGPNYETPAEIRALRTLGADAVGMSTVPEVLVAVHDGMSVLGISLITNFAAGIKEEKLSHGEVTRAAEKAGKNFTRLVGEIIKRI